LWGELIPEKRCDEDAGGDGFGIGEVSGDEDVCAVGETVDLVVSEVGEVLQDGVRGAEDERLQREEDEGVEGRGGYELEPEVLE
jgi:hypothetical protein